MWVRTSFGVRQLAAALEFPVDILYLKREALKRQKRQQAVSEGFGIVV